MGLYRRAFVLAPLFLLAGCATAGTTAALPVFPSQRVANQATPSVSGRRVTLRFVVPNETHARLQETTWGYISPGSKSIKIVAEGTTTADLALHSRFCQAVPQGRECAMSGIQMYPAQPTVVEFYDGGIDARKHPTGRALSFGKTILHVTAATKYVAVYQHGLIDRVDASVANVHPRSGKISTTPVSLTLYDSDGYVIPQPAIFFSAKNKPTHSQPGPFTLQFAASGILAANDGAFSFVENGRIQRKSQLLLTRSAKVELRYIGRGVRTAQLQVIGPANTVTIDLAPKAAFGTSIALPSLGPDARICSERFGTIWYTEPDLKAIARFDPQRSGRQVYRIKSGRTPMDIACVKAETGGSFVYIALSGDVIGYLFRNQIDEIALPTANAGLSSVGIQSYPEGNATFTEQLAGKIGIYSRDPLLGTWFEFPLPAGGHPTNIIGEWFSDPANNAIGTLNNSTTVVEYPLPHAGSQPGALTFASQYVQSNPPVWFVELTAPRIGEIQQGSGRISEYATDAPLRYVATGWDGYVYATDLKNQVEAIDPQGNVNVVGRTSDQILAIVAGANDDLWALTWGSKGSSLLEVLP